ncbi:penicillin-binding protein 2 [Candidatus Dojkabacteria bacterium]|uniref:beta-lactamase n=1 Tax=Candidatus Dojkabacteria bacterium TaxID=2099670 RepID=A0A955LBK6_9BACT|nr:penicillin-binding protein 2 [Candidatus Dojkabacteria bacterium]
MSQNNLINTKIRTIHMLFFFIFLIIVIALVRWQLVYAEDFRKIADGRVYSTELTSLRGSIYSKDGSTLAYSEPRFDMYVWMNGLEYVEEKNVQTRDEFLKKVAPIIDKTPEGLSKEIRENYEDKGLLWFKIGDNLSAEQWQDLINLKTDSNEKRDLQGFQFLQSSQRVYPEGRLASHVLGLTNEYKNQEVGLGGIEGHWNGDLNPRKGLLIKETDAVGQSVASSLFATIEPKPGSSIYTTIDKKLQTIVEEKTKAAAEQFGAESTSTIIMDPKTGAILAMSNYPDYNPNLREETDPSAYTNQSLTIPYEVGSIGKVFTFSVGIDTGVFAPDTLIMPNGHEGCEKFSDDLEPLCTWDKKPQGPLTAYDCFEKSDNICFYHMANDFIMNLDEGENLKQEGKEKNFYDYLYDFGIGRNTGIDLSGEDPGVLKELENWNLGDVAAFSYGHGYLTTPLQVITAVSVIPNRGIRMRPHILDKVVKGDGEVIEYEPLPFDFEQTIIKPETAELVGNVMHQIYLSNIRDYEYWYTDLKNYNIGMKSGTALIANQYGYTNDVNSTQIGFDMSDERSFIMLVKVSKPEGGQLSYYNSRVMWLDIFAAVKDHLGVQRIQ